MSKGEKGSFLLVIVLERYCFWSPGLAWSKTWRGATLERPETAPRDFSQQHLPPQNRVKQPTPEIDPACGFCPAFLSTNALDSRFAEELRRVV